MRSGDILVRQLPLLESRTYLHGTTLFNDLLTYVPSGATISFTVSRRIDSDRVKLIAHASSEERINDAHAKLVWRHEGASGLVSVVPLLRSASPRREPYDEGIVMRAVSREDETVALEGVSPFTFVATLIPMFKILLADKAQSMGAGQWMFTRLDVEPPKGEFVPIRLQFCGLLGGSLARSAIECRGRTIGTLYFSWVPATAVPVHARSLG